MKVLELGRIEYQAALEIQNRHVGDLLSGTGGEVFLLLEHEPVYTIGRTRDQSSLRGGLPHPVVETNRGGQATFHGPGQLVGYPILDLNTRGRDLHIYLRFLEEFLIRLCAEYGVVANRRNGLTGVWIGEKKIASLGVGVKKWVAMHGFALNVLESCLPAFTHITPCGIAGVEMTCLEKESGAPIFMPEITSRAAGAFPALLEEILHQGQEPSASRH
ncbi:MAG: lipoyl(octanoyl) transferase LipB [Terrimicrobiaceae bacterium]|jgi:lipoyl(octanoyl) transferase|nr:lipoyl(octanoyl) transferase LipB [Terrimicrobiaceae bacterium]